MSDVPPESPVALHGTASPWWFVTDHSTVAVGWKPAPVTVAVNVTRSPSNGWAGSCSTFISGGCEGKISTTEFARLFAAQACVPSDDTAYRKSPPECGPTETVPARAPVAA